MKLHDRSKPRTLFKIENKDLVDFISKCIGEASQRPTASELLEDEYFYGNPAF